jgi:histidine ammonia-lyase
MSMGAALKAARAVELATRVLAIELLCACQAIDLLKPLSTSPPLARVHDFVRTRVPMLDDDRPPSTDIDTITSMIDGGELERACTVKVN